MYQKALIIVIIVLIIFIVMIKKSKSEGLANATDVIKIIDETQKNRGNIFDFRNRIGDRQFSAYKYAKLITLYKTGQLSIANANQVLSSPIS